MVAKIIISESLKSRIKEFDDILKKNNIKKNHPDVLYVERDEKLGIEETKKIRDFLSLKPMSAKSRFVFIEEASNLTIEAQNSILKTIEELPEGVLFYLGSESDSKFLPTIISRCEIIRVQPARNASRSEAGGGTGYRVQDEAQIKDIEKLLNSTIEERFEYIEKIKERHEFLKSLVDYFHQNLASHLTGGNVKFLKELLQSEQWAKQNVNIRAILEYLMLKMPEKHSSL